MAVVDFRSGGYAGAQPRQARDYSQDQNAQQRDDSDDWSQSGHWDESRYHTDADHGLLAGDASVAGKMRRLTQYVGALVSVALMLMLAVWGYKLVVRDVSGVPIIRAIQGEARTAPEDPGGELTRNTGLAVNAVAGGARERPASQVAIAPGATALGSEDVAMGDLGATARRPSRETELPVTAPLNPVIARPDSEVRAAQIEDTTEPTGQSGLEAPGNEAVTDLAGAAAATGDINAALTEAAAAAAPPPATIVASTRPAPRPRRAVAAPAPVQQPAQVTEVAAAPAAPAAAPTQKVAPSAIASGAAMVQIGAFDSNALADGEWKRVSGKFGSLFSGKAQVIQKAETGGRTFWRLRAAGFESRDEARRFCAALIAEGIDCIPATSK